jgi:hypothetical protein
MLVHPCPVIPPIAVLDEPAALVNEPLKNESVIVQLFVDAFPTSPPNRHAPVIDEVE